MKHCYVHSTRNWAGSPYTRRLVKICDPTHKVSELDGCQNAWTRAALAVSMEKNEKTSVSKACLYTKLKKKSGWWLFIHSCHSCLQQQVRAMNALCSYMSHIIEEWLYQDTSRVPVRYSCVQNSSWNEGKTIFCLYISRVLTPLYREAPLCKIIIIANFDSVLKFYWMTFLLSDNQLLWALILTHLVYLFWLGT